MLLSACVETVRLAENTCADGAGGVYGCLWGKTGPGGRVNILQTDASASDCVSRSRDMDLDLILALSLSLRFEWW